MFSAKFTFLFYVSKAPKLTPRLIPPDAQFFEKASKGGDVDFYCGDATGSKPFKYRWTFMNHTQIAPLCHRAVMKMNSSHLRLHGLDPSDTGEYTCKISNAFGSAYRSFLLFVYGKPLHALTSLLRSARLSVLLMK